MLDRNDPLTQEITVQSLTRVESEKGAKQNSSRSAKGTLSKDLDRTMTLTQIKSGKESVSRGMDREMPAN